MKTFEQFKNLPMWMGTATGSVAKKAYDMGIHLFEVGVKPYQNGNNELYLSVELSLYSIRIPKKRSESKYVETFQALIPLDFLQTLDVNGFQKLLKTVANDLVSEAAFFITGEENAKVQ